MRDAEIDQMPTWTPFRGLPLFHVLRKAKETQHLCPAACLPGTLTLERNPKQDTGTKALGDTCTSRSPSLEGLCHHTRGRALKVVIIASCDPHVGPRGTKELDEQLLVIRLPQGK